jgi:uncharacterized membrane protein AbrB (regulator of aidB expression)
MTGPLEAATSVATGVTNALKSTPVLLLILIFNIAFMAMLAWIVIRYSSTQAAEVERWAEIARSCMPPRSP